MASLPACKPGSAPAAFTARLLREFHLKYLASRIVSATNAKPGKSSALIQP